MLSSSESIIIKWNLLLLYGNPILFIIFSEIVASICEKTDTKFLVLPSCHRLPQKINLSLYASVPLLIIWIDILFDCCFNIDYLKRQRLQHSECWWLRFSYNKHLSQILMYTIPNSITLDWQIKLWWLRNVLAFWI